MTSRTTAVARARRWLCRSWGVLTSVAVLGGIAAIPLKDVWVVSAVLTFGVVWGYLLRWSQGRTLLHQKIDGLRVMLTALVNRDSHDDAPAQPHLTLVSRD